MRRAASGARTFATSRDGRSRAAATGSRCCRGPQRGRQDEPARGALLRAHGGVVADARRARADRASAPSWPASRSRSATGRERRDLTALAQRGAGKTPARRRQPASAPRRRARGAAGRSASSRRIGSSWSRARPRCGARTSTSSSRALWPARAESRRRYGRALAQRNALLAARPRRRRAAGRRSTPGTLELAREGAAADRRARATRSRSSPRGSAELATGLGLEGEPRAALRAAQRRRGPRRPSCAELRERRDSDIQLARTTHGPHLDELQISLDGRALRRYGSQGQQRAAAAGAALLRARGAARGRRSSRR